MMHHDGFSISGAGSVLGIVIPVAVVLLIILVVVLLVRALRVRYGWEDLEEVEEPEQDHPVSENARTLLHARYDRGEIGREDYLQRLQDLLGD